MPIFVDPRTDPKPQVRKQSRETTEEWASLGELHVLCREGRLYDVERWIQAGRPLQVAEGTTIKGRRLTSAIEIALEAGNRALVLLLLCNGYDQNIEPRCPLDLAIQSRQWDLVDVLMEWGADIQRVSVVTLLESYRTELLERFWTLGIDFTAEHALASALAYHSSNKPLFGFAKRHRENDPRIQRELNIALAHHADEENEKGVLLCLWAGGDPHAPAASLRFGDVDDDSGDSETDGDRFVGWTAIHEACGNGDSHILERLGPDPCRDNFDDLYRAANNGAIIKVLSRFALPKDVGAVICRQLFWMQPPPFGYPQSTDTLESLFKVGARWLASSAAEISDVRRSLLRMSDATFVHVMKLFARGDNCSPDILQGLGRTPAMRERMQKVGFIPKEKHDIARFLEPKPTRSREVLAKFGVERPKATRRLPPSVEIGNQGPNKREIRIERAALFERVWSEPVEKLANSWGLSGRGLAKACERLQIPVPPRGFWAKIQHKQKVRRPRLPALPTGEAEEILIYAPK